MRSERLKQAPGEFLQMKSERRFNGSIRARVKRWMKET